MSVFVVEVASGFELQAKKMMESFHSKLGLQIIKNIFVAEKKQTVFSPSGQAATKSKSVVPGYVFLQTASLDDAEEIPPVLYSFIQKVAGTYRKILRLLNGMFTDKTLQEFLHRIGAESEIEIQIPVDEQEEKTTIKQQKELMHQANTATTLEDKKKALDELDKSLKSSKLSLAAAREFIKNKIRMIRFPESWLTNSNVITAIKQLKLSYNVLFELNKLRC
jgi:transcription antitermination factor NusG